MTALIPKLFRNIAYIPFSDNAKDNLIETITTISYGALVAGCLYNLRKMPYAGAIVVIGSAHYIDDAGTSCGVAMITSYHAYLFANVCMQFAQAGKSIPMEFGLPLILCSVIAWYFFNRAGIVAPGPLRPQAS